MSETSEQQYYRFVKSVMGDSWRGIKFSDDKEIAEIQTRILNYISDTWKNMTPEQKSKF